jgi:hypothetical protein
MSQSVTLFNQPGIRVVDKQLGQALGLENAEAANYRAKLHPVGRWDDGQLAVVRFPLVNPAEPVKLADGVCVDLDLVGNLFALWFSVPRSRRRSGFFNRHGRNGTDRYGVTLRDVA